MRPKGFSLIEIAIVLFIMGIMMSGFLSLLNTSAQNRATADLNNAMESVKSTAILTALNDRTYSTTCVSGLSCFPTAACGWSSNCPMAVSTYNVPASIATPTDPWGRQLVYARQTATVTSDTPPITSIFTVKSFGPDGVGDITHTVTAAEFVTRLTKIGM